MVESEGLDIKNNNLDQSVPSTQEVSSAPEMVQSEGADINNNTEQGVEEPQEVSPAPRIDVYALEEKIQKNSEPRTVSEFYREMGKISEEYLDTIFSIQEDLQEIQEAWVKFRDLEEEFDLLFEKWFESKKFFNRVWNSLLRTENRTHLIHQKISELAATQGLPRDFDEQGWRVNSARNWKMDKNVQAERTLRREYAGGKRDPKKMQKLQDTITPIFMPRQRNFAPRHPSLEDYVPPRVTYADKVAEQDFRRATNPRRMEELAKANELNAPTSRFIDEFNALPRDRQEDLRAYARQLMQESEERSEDTGQEEFTA